MERPCPFCGNDLSGAEPGHSPGTVACPHCGQEVDAPAGPQAAAEPRAQAPAAGPEAPAPEAAPPPPPVGQAPPAWGGAGPEPEPGPRSPAWEGSGGVWARLWRTTWQVLLHPARTFAAPARPGLVWAFTYGLILGTLGSAASALWGRGQGPASGDPSQAVWWLLFLPLMVAASMFVFAALAHLFLMILGGAKRGFAATFRVVGYSNAAGVFQLVPAVGMVVGWVWSVVVLVGGLAAAHGVGRGRVFLALFLPLFLIFLVLVAIAVAVGVGAFLAALSLPPETLRL